MKPILFIICIAFATVAALPAKGQNLATPTQGQLQNYINNLQGQQNFINIPAPGNTADAILKWANFKLLQDAPASYSFVQSSIKQSPEGTYYNLDLTYQNAVVFGRMAKVFVDKQSTIRYVYHNLFPLVNPAGTLPTQNDAINLYNNHLSHLKLIDKTILWVNDGKVLQPAISLTLKDTVNYTVAQQLYTPAGTLLYTLALQMSAGADTPAIAYVYNPDPITTSHTTYGGSYTNNDGKDNAALQSQLQRQIIRVSVDGDSMILANNKFYITEITSPVWPTTRVAIGNKFWFSRDNHSFGETNAYYHLNTIVNYTASLGYNLPGYKIQVDAHAFSGAENSRFTPTDAPPSLQFGDGGIPDAEDAEVVVHELGHALAYGAAPNTAIGSERLAIDEGLGDYFAVSYTKAIDTFNWTKVFSWDGNNGSWRGRTINYLELYPNLKNNKWTDGQLWSTSFIRIYDNTSKATADKLMLETLYHLAPNITMPQLAKATLFVDSIKNGGINSNIIRCCFGSTGVLDTLFAQGCQLVSVENVLPSNQNTCTLHNTLGFAQGSTDALVVFNKTGVYNLVLTDVNGRAIWQQEVKNENNIPISSQNIAAGMYLLHITDTNGAGQTVKLLRY
jgi:hypothetical protein